MLSNAAQDLLQRDADIAVRMFEPSQEALVARRIGDVAIGMFAHRRYLERRGTPATLADLAGHTLIGFDTETPALRAMLRTIPGLSRDVFSFRADSDLAQLAALRAGFGVSGCQLGVARRHPDLVRVVPALEFALPMWLVMHEDLRSTPRCRVVFDGLVEGLGAYVAGSEGAQGL